MKKHGIINSHIAKVLADLGHTDTIVIADVGLPIPADVLKIDLALELGTPSFNEVIELICKDMVVEKVTIANEMEHENAPALAFIQQQFSGVKIQTLSHEVFKLQTHSAKAVIRTGEAKPYANCILHAGVSFG